MTPECYRLLPATGTPHRLEGVPRGIGVQVLICGRCGGAPGMDTLLADCPVQALDFREKALVRVLICRAAGVRPTVAEYNAGARELNDRLLDAWIARRSGGLKA